MSKHKKTKKKKNTALNVFMNKFSTGAEMPETTVTRWNNNDNSEHHNCFLNGNNTISFKIL